MPIQQGWMAEAKYHTNPAADSGLVDLQVSTVRTGLFGWASLHCALQEVCHCASVAVNLVSLPEASEVKKGSSLCFRLPL